MSDSEDEATNGAFYKPSFVLIAIDAHPSMFVKKEGDGTTPFKDCVTACYNLANSLIFTQNKRSWSPFGIVLGLEDAAASFVNFDDNVLKSIKLLKEKSNLSDEQLSDTYQRKAAFDLSAFLLFCKKKFKEVKSVFYKRIIIYITNDDNPVGGDKTQKFAALNEAKNLEPSEITLQMVTMNSNFDYKIFYNEMFAVMKTPLLETVVEDDEGLLDKLSSLIMMRHSQRRLNFFPFLDDPSRFIKITQKSFIQEEKLYNNGHYTYDGQQVIKSTRNTPGATTSHLLKFGMVSLEFDVGEHLSIKSSDLPIGYTLLHVSNRVTEVGLVLTKTSVLEVNAKEDLKFFDSFWQYCVNKKKVLICARKLKKLDQIRYVELIPKFANNTKIFITKTIPFCSEHKNISSKLALDEPQANYSQEKVKTVNALIESLSFDFHPKMFTNPSLAKKKSFLRSKFLEEPKEDVEDVTLDNDGIDTRLEGVADAFKQLFGLEEDEPKTKRKASAAPAKWNKRKK